MANEIENLEPYAAAHRKAMDLVEQADRRKRLGQFGNGDAERREALQLEMQAAYGCPADLEPTRSVLFRSAASIAKELGETDLVRQLVLRGLAGDPPPEIRTELFEAANATDQVLVAIRLVDAVTTYMDWYRNEAASNSIRWSNARSELGDALAHAMLLLKAP
jgi:hypothetical protein